MKSIIRLFVCLLLIVGWGLAALSLHVIRTPGEIPISLVTKDRFGITDTYVDTSTIILARERADSEAIYDMVGNNNQLVRPAPAPYVLAAAGTKGPATDENNSNKSNPFTNDNDDDLQPVTNPYTMATSATLQRSNKPADYDMAQVINKTNSDDKQKKNVWGCCCCCCRCFNNYNYYYYYY